ncbi:MAG: mechanosensitive ion channel protein MscS [Anaerocolumna sp.]|jgi:small-conductance mechanosensitive channel|nr:mechanosensitive ion channel protein MscS [Anaerocolumna sp.]
MNDMYRIAAFIALTLVINKFNKLLFKGILKRRNKIHLKFLRSIISVLIYAVGIFSILNLFEFTKNLASTLVTSSSIIVAVAVFAAQESLNDILSGVMLSWSRPFEIGERVQIVGLNITGIVEDITVRHTIIRTFNHAKVVVPNSVLNKQVIENNSNVDSRSGNFLDVIISYESDLDQAINILEELVSSHALVLNTEEAPVKVMIRDLAENGIALRVQVWTRDVGENFQACSDLRKSVLEKFKENNIEIPYKQIKVINS